MGYLTDIINALEEPADGEQALIESICLSAFADEELSDVEQDTCIGYIQALLEMSEEEAEDVVTDTMEYIQKVGFEEAFANVVETLQSLDHSISRAAFVAVAAVQLVDGEVNEDEETFLNEFGEQVNISSIEWGELMSVATKFSLQT